MASDKVQEMCKSEASSLVADHGEVDIPKERDEISVEDLEIEGDVLEVDVLQN